MPDLVVSPNPLGPNNPSTPVADLVTVSASRVRNPSQALTVQPSPSWAGSVTARDWNQWFVDGLTGPGMGLYRTIPVVYQNPADGVLSVRHVYLHFGNTTETVKADVVAQDFWEGQRGDNLISAFITAVDTPRANPLSPTLWSFLDVSGWGGHITATGRVITAYGRALPDGVFPAVGGARKTLHGTFPDGEYDGPNDLCYDPVTPTIQYIADTFNDRIMKVTETSPGFTTHTVYWSGGLNDPYSLYAEADGTLIVADRGNNRVIRIPRNGLVGGTPVNIATSLNMPMVVRPFSDGNICCVEHGAPRRILEITRATGALRTIDNMRTQNQDPGTVWLWMDVDKVGTCGPVDDIFTVMSSTFQTLKRTSRDGTYGVFGTPTWAESYVVKGSGLNHGAIYDVSDPVGHYPWAIACAKREAKFLTSGSGSMQTRQIRRFAAGDSTSITSTNKTRLSSGRTIWAGINFDTAKSSPFIHTGWSAHNFLGAPNHNTESYDAMGWIQFAAEARGGFNGNQARTYTDTDIQNVKYYIKMNARRGLSDSTMDPIGFEPVIVDPPVVIAIPIALDIDISSVADPDPPDEDPPVNPPLAIGVRVRVTAAPSGLLNVRSQQDFVPPNNLIIGTQADGQEGVISGGSGQSVQGFPRWQVNFDNAPDGWVAGTYLLGIVATPVPPPTTGDPGTWLKVVVPTRTVHQPLFAGNQAIAEGQPGGATTTAPNSIQAAGALFRSFSGARAGLGKYWWIGGGHAGNPGNDFDVFDIPTRTWQPIPFLSEAPPPYIAGVANPIWQGILSGGISTGGLSPTGRPWVHHFYRHMAVDTLRNRLLLMTGAGFGAYELNGTWVPLASNNKNLGEVQLDSNGGVHFDSRGNGTLWIFASNTRNGAPRGIYKYTFNADGTVATKGMAYGWTALAGWNNATNIVVPVKGPGSLVYVFMQPSSSWSDPVTPYRLFTHDLDATNGNQTWDQTFVRGTPAWDGLFANGGTMRTWDRRTATAELYWWAKASGGVPAGWWIKSEATNTWAFTADGVGAPVDIAPWTLTYSESADVFIGMRADNIYAGGGARAGGGIADTWIFNP